MKKRMLSLLLSLCLVLTMVPNFALATEEGSEPSSDWSEPVCASVNGGELMTLSAALSKAIALTGDVTVTLSYEGSIDLSGWKAFDTNTGKFKTLTLDGNNETITNLSEPLFGNTTGKWTVKNLTFNDVKVKTISANGFTGASVIVVGTSGDRKINLENIKVNGGTITGNDPASNPQDFNGGLIGYIQLGLSDDGEPVVVINKCKITNVTILSETGGAVGGVVGHINNGCVAIRNTTVGGNTLYSIEDGYREDKSGAVIGTLINSTAYVDVTETALSHAYESNVLAKLVGRIGDPNSKLTITGGEYYYAPVATSSDADSLTATRLINSATADCVKLGGVFTQNEENKWVIGVAANSTTNKNYASLVEAVSTATAGDTIRVLDGVTELFGDGVVVDKNLTIDLNGAAYSVIGNPIGAEGNKVNGFYVTDNSNVTIKNGTIATIYGSEATTAIDVQGTLTLDDVDLIGEADTESVLSVSGTAALGANTTVTAATGKTPLAVTDGFAAVTKDSSVTVAAPMGYAWDSNGALVEAEVQIGTVGYITLEAAVEAAQENDRITLLKPVTLEQQLTIGVNGVTLDGNDKTVSAPTSGTWATDDANKYLLLLTGADVNVENLTLNGNSVAQFGMQYYCSSGAISDLTINGFAMPMVVNGSKVTASNAITLSGNTYNSVNVAYGANVTGTSEFNFAGATLTADAVYFDANDLNRAGGDKAKFVITPASGWGYGEAEGLYGYQPGVAASIGGKSYATVQDAINAAAAGETVTLQKDIAVTAPVVVAKQLTLDLNGKTISNTTALWNATNKDWSLISVRGGDLTITGNGALEALENDCYAADVQSGKLTIQNGTYVGNISAVYVLTGTLNVEGGTYSIQQLADNTKDERYTLNCKDENHKNNTANIVVTGGTFYNYNPAGSTSENPTVNFLADGYAATKVGKNYCVTAVTGGSSSSTVVQEAVSEALKDIASQEPVKVEVPKVEAAADSNGATATVTDVVKAVNEAVKETSSNKEVNLTIPVADATVTFNKAAVQTIASKNKVQLTVENVTEEQETTKPENATAVYELSLTDGTNKIEFAADNAGTATVTIPNTTGKTSGVELWYKNDGEGAQWTKFTGALTVTEEEITFTTSHFSQWAPVVAPAVSTATYGAEQTSNLGLIEPWFLRTNFSVYKEEDGVKTYLTPDVDYANYGVYFVKKADMGSTTLDSLTVEMLNNMVEAGTAYKNDASNVYQLRGSNYNSFEITEKDGTKRVTARFDKEIYTYELNQDIYAIFYYQLTGETETRLYKVTYNMYNMANNRKDKDENYGEKERAVYAAMVQMYNTVAAYREEWKTNNNKK